ncbi:MAG: alpha/beta fold hydrolase [Candidatus Omnitrophica bacterium]|nr:alpha/beta fold hydrolase [Candidatus Omnitrophota bacterium]MDD5653027.1 alpha/beta fold hydrolase [Candidatus Omnitrophota bacterium]
MKKLIKKFYLIIISYIALSLLFLSSCFAQVSKNWNDSDVYRPAPILFLHGFASGNPHTWDQVTASFRDYFSKYYSGYDSDPTVLPATHFPYLEVIDFGPGLVNCNSSVDTYRAGDHYVLTGQRNPGDQGWSDKLNSAIETLRQYYQNADNSSQKVILVAHSMGGLAARQYLKNYGYTAQKIEKVILIGTPNLGSQWATNAVFLHRNRRWGVYIPAHGWLSPSQIENMDKYLEQKKLIDIDGDAVWDMDETDTGSGFIDELNDHYPNSIAHFVIAGKHFSSFNGGDTIVSLENQLGKNVLVLKDQRTINALHWDEPAASVSGDNPLLKFLDPACEINITYPNPDVITEIYEPSTDLQGLVYKEYLPADSKLHIKIIRTDDNSSVLDEYRVNSVRPTLSWVPNNPDSPVAEFNQPITFPGPGTYKISCSVKNPAENESDIKDVFVKVTLTTDAYVIVHCHNPEGIEINSIDGMKGNAYNYRAKIFCDTMPLGISPQYPSQHNQAKLITSGTHTIKATFNGMTKEQVISVTPNETKVITFVFDRAIHDFKDFWYLSPTGSASANGAGSGIVVGDMGHLIFSKAFSSPFINISGSVYSLGVSTVEYDVSGEGTVTVSTNSFRMQGSMSGNINIRAGRGEAYVYMVTETNKYFDIPNPQAEGYATWFYQQEYSDGVYGGVIAKGECHSSEIASASAKAYLGNPSLDYNYQPEADAVCSSVPYNVASNGGF